MKKAGILPYTAGIVMAVFFGLSFLVTQQGLAEIPPMVLMSFRFALAAAFMTILRAFGIIHIDYKNKPVRGVIILSVFYPGISFFFETISLKYVSSSQAGILVSIMPIFVTLFGILILKEKPMGIQVFFIIVSVTGVMVTVVFAKSSGNEGTFFGILLMLISVLGGSINNVLSRKYSTYFSSVEITYTMLCLGAVIFTCISLIQGIFDRQVLEAYLIPFRSGKMMFVVLELSIGTSAVAFFCMNYMLSKLKAVNAAVFINLATVISIAAGVLIVKEHLYWYQAVGGILIVLSVWGTNHFENRVKNLKEKEGA